MKTTAKIIACGLWFGFLVWLSIYGNGFFFDFVDFIKTKIIRTEISPGIDFAITFIPWNGFISLLIWLPIFLMKKRRSEAAKEIVVGIIFFFYLLAFNLFGILIWFVFFPEAIGNFTNTSSYSTLERYAINDGWTSFQFGCLWWTYIIIANAFSALMAFLTSQLKKQSFYKIISS